MERLDLIGADAAEGRALALLINLGFSADLRTRPMSALSGGWRVRTCLAAAIFARPDVLMLDEPTNHLSIGAVRRTPQPSSNSAAYDLCMRPPGEYCTAYICSSKPRVHVVLGPHSIRIPPSHMFMLCLVMNMPLSNGRCSG
eukprot:scaffold218869_cov36-Tisochrysis_lutea.AAC.2